MPGTLECLVRPKVYLLDPTHVLSGQRYECIIQSILFLVLSTLHRAAYPTEQLLLFYVSNTRIFENLVLVTSQFTLWYMCTRTAVHSTRHTSHARLPCAGLRSIHSDNRTAARGLHQPEPFTFLPWYEYELELGIGAAAAAAAVLRTPVLL